MKLYQHIPKDLVRIQILKQGEESFFLNIDESSVGEVVLFIKSLVLKYGSPLPEGKRTSVNIRAARGGENLKSKSVSLFGYTPKEFAVIIVKEINKLNGI